MKDWTDEELMDRLDELLGDSNPTFEDMCVILDELDTRDGQIYEFDIGAGWEDLVARAPHKKLRRGLKKYPLVAVIVLLGLITTTAAAVGFGLHEKFIGFFHIEGQDTTLLEDAIETPECTVTNNDVTVTIKQTLADSAGVYVLYEVKVPEEVTLPDSTSAYMEVLLPTLNNPGKGAGSGYYAVVERDSHSFTAIASCYGNTEQIKPGPIKLYLRNLCYIDENGIYQTLIEGAWDLSWELKNVYDRMTFEPELAIAINGKTEILEEISLSPITLSLTATSNEVFNVPISLILQDGSVLPIDESSGEVIGELSGQQDTDGHSYKWVLYYRFSTLLDSARVEKLVINETEIPLA